MHHVLWLASWYPNRNDPFNGDFIERHAAAVSRFAKTTVLFIVKDESLAEGQLQVEKTVENNVTVYRAYYGRSSRFSLVEKLLSFNTYFKLQRRLYAQIEREEGTPGIVHVQVAMKAGMLARYLKRKLNIPYVVTEHWTGYFKQHIPNVYSGNRLLKRLNKKVLQYAGRFLPVSDNLGKTVNADFVRVPYTVIPNVVNTELFFYHPQQPLKFRFIHPSLMNYQKNPAGIIKACKMVKDRGYDFEVLMVGKEDEALINLAKANDLYNSVIYFKPAIPYAGVAKEMQQSSALLLFSRFENLPCVILEALCCGLPVISSSVGGINEVVNETNGILVQSENISALANAMCKMMDNYAGYNCEVIAATAIQKFNYDTVGRQYLDVYTAILSSTV